eukprot:CAMPEP_0115863506 /NCGR_PEP_ID=MMETSP0287-20121206/18723_1 /TAXON_ID=412157 /ORGANISM="Chrysochromulina rotalis, Strain UIO044" /LENGTH=266 /DNA_ID=CAMNT_0003317953 /DNA_START=22 /DNA_END=823 /DNA_ORIENTATION=+
MCHAMASLVVALSLPTACRSTRVGDLPCSRTQFLASAWAAGFIGQPRTAAWAAPTDTLDQLKVARAQLEPCAVLIDEGAWDTVRNVVKTAPLQNTKVLITKFISEAGDDRAEDLVVEREDLVQALQFLDMSVYNNVFVGEQNGRGKRGAGVQLDRETPRRHLQEAKDALDVVKTSNDAELWSTSDFPRSTHGKTAMALIHTSLFIRELHMFSPTNRQGERANRQGERGFFSLENLPCKVWRYANDVGQYNTLLLSGSGSDKVTQNR